MQKQIPRTTYDPRSELTAAAKALDSVALTTNLLSAV